jgi:hypothetical protein
MVPLVAPNLPGIEPLQDGRYTIAVIDRQRFQAQYGYMFPEQARLMPERRDRWTDDPGWARILDLMHVVETNLADPDCLASIPERDLEDIMEDMRQVQEIQQRRLSLDRTPLRNPGEGALWTGMDVAAGSLADAVQAFIEHPSVQVLEDATAQANLRGIVEDSGRAVVDQVRSRRAEEVTKALLLLVRDIDRWEHGTYLGFTHLTTSDRIRITVRLLRMREAVFSASQQWQKNQATIDPEATSTLVYAR